MKLSQELYQLYRGGVFSPDDFTLLLKVVLALEVIEQVQADIAKIMTDQTQRTLVTKRTAITVPIDQLSEWVERLGKAIDNGKQADDS